MEWIRMIVTTKSQAEEKRENKNIIDLRNIHNTIIKPRKYRKSGKKRTSWTITGKPTEIRTSFNMSTEAIAKMDELIFAGINISRSELIRFSVINALKEKERFFQVVSDYFLFHDLDFLTFDPKYSDRNNITFRNPKSFENKLSRLDHYLIKNRSILLRLTISYYIQQCHDKKLLD